MEVIKEKETWEPLTPHLVTCGVEKFRILIRPNIRSWWAPTSLRRVVLLPPEVTDTRVRGVVRRVSPHKSHLPVGAGAG